MKPKTTCHIIRQASINTRLGSVPNLNCQASSPINKEWKPPYHIRKQKTDRHKLKNRIVIIISLVDSGILIYKNANLFDTATRVILTST